MIRTLFLHFDLHFDFDCRVNDSNHIFIEHLHFIKNNHDNYYGITELI